MRKYVLLSSLVVGLLCGCGDERSGDAARAPDAAPSNDTYLLERLSLKLRNGAALSKADEARFARMPLEKVVSEMTADKRFVETVFDFNTYFLGFKSPRLVYPEGRVDQKDSVSLINYSSAVQSAQAYAKGGDYLSLFEFDQPYYASPLTSGKQVYNADYTKDFDENRARAVNRYLNNIKRLEQKLEDQMDDTTFCYDKDGEEYSDFADDFSNGFQSLELSEDLNSVSDPIGRTISQFCSSVEKPASENSDESDESEEKSPATIPDALKKELLVLIRDMRRFLADLPKYHPIRYKVNSVLDIKEFPSQLVRMVDKERRRASGMWFWKALTNSSTNYNRKRGAYILKRFFCDDLTPIGIEQPKAHAGNRHADDPACMSCHYKLDPIAGYFRNYGYKGLEFPPVDFDEYEIVFDDGASKKYKDYITSWLSTEAERTWNVGYIRSPIEASLNSYALEQDGPVELFKMLKNAPEVRQCLVKKAFKYLVDEEVNIDGSYLRYLTEQFNKRAKTNSSAALRELFVSIVQSESFRQSSTKPGACYDYAPGVDPAQRPPCEIADVVERNCLSCHSGAGAQGGLNLQEWTSLSDGQGFKHQDGSKLLSRKESFARLIHVLTTSDENERMPLNKYMSSADRETLFKFFSLR